MLTVKTRGKKIRKKSLESKGLGKFSNECKRCLHLINLFTVNRTGLSSVEQRWPNAIMETTLCEMLITDPVHYRSNLGSLLTLWDRMFRTYFEPSQVNRTLTFGIGEKIRPVRLVLGV